MILTSADLSNMLKKLKRYGFSDRTIAQLRPKVSESEIRAIRQDLNINPVYKMIDTCAGEFKSETPYFYSTFATENESIPSKHKSVIVLGSGPIRIGQGVEFDYTTVHSIKALQASGYEAIVINNNPETVSTDFSISDKLYFEPLTVEDVMNVIELEQPEGVLVQFGGQTAINLAEALEQRGVNILGTSVKDLNRAEDRDEFNRLLKTNQVIQPQGSTATNAAEAIDIAQRIGFPVLVRPSYVLGGRAMEIVHDVQHLKDYMAKAVQVSHHHPVLIDQYLIGTECEADVICDGEEVLIPGIMEHVERSGVHSGDSMAVYPPQSLTETTKNTIVTIATKLARDLGCVGLMNVQFIINNGQVYVIEVNPRASRTVPFLSKVTKIPMTQIATRVILGQSLADQGYHAGLYPESALVHVKAPVFSFTKLNQVDSLLGPEMKSTGEVMGTDQSLPKALYKAFEATKVHVANHGTVFMTVKDEDKVEMTKLAQRFTNLGYQIEATSGTADVLENAGVTVRRVAKLDHDNRIQTELKQQKIQIMINTISNTSVSAADGIVIRNTALTYGVPLFTSLDTVSAILRVLESQAFTTQRL